MRPEANADREAIGCCRCWTLIRRGVLTHDATPGEKLRSLVASGFDVIRDFQEAYGYSEVRRPRFNPTPRDVDNMLPTLAWLCWLKRQNNGPRDFKILLSRCRDLPWWRLAQRFGRSERQVQRWQDGAIAAIYDHHATEVWKLEPGGSHD